MLPDPRNCRAVIVGAAEYTHLESLPSVANSAAAVAELLTDERYLGLPAENCTVLRDPAGPAEVLDALAQAVRRATDTLVFYFAGHGILRPDSYELYLALGRARHESWWHAVRYDDVRRILMGGPRARKVVLLDCCYGGMAMMPGMGGAEIGNRVRIRGTYLMTAAAENEVALAPPDKALTAFTGALVDTVRAGVPDGPEVLDLETIYARVHDRLVVDERCPPPQRRSDHDGGRIGLVCNVWNRPIVEDELDPREREALHLGPARLAEVVAELGEADAGRLLRAVAARRPGQGVAAAVAHFDREGDAAAVATLLGAAAGRRAEEVLAVVEALRKTGPRARVADLLSRCAQEPPARVMALARRLPEADRDVLLADALQSRVTQPPQLHTLVVTLLAAGLTPETGGAVQRFTAGLPGPRILDLADALRAAGHENTALIMYERVAALVAERPVEAVAQLAAALRRAGRDEQAGALVGLTAGRHRTAKERVELLTALWTADAPAEPAEQLGHLGDDDLVELILELYRRDRHHARVRQAMLAALRERAAGLVLRAFAALRDAGYPLEARSLVEHCGEREPADVAELAAGLAAAGQHDDARILLSRGLGDGDGLLAVLPVELRPEAERLLRGRGPEELAGLAARLPAEPLTWLARLLPADTDPHVLARYPRLALAKLLTLTGDPAFLLAVAVRTGQPHPVAAGVAVALAEAGADRLARTLLGMPEGTPIAPAELVVRRLLPREQPAGMAGRWRQRGLVDRAGLPPGTSVLHLVAPQGPGGTITVFTADAVHFGLRGGLRVTVPYPALGELTVEWAEPGGTRLSDGTDTQELELRDRGLHDLLRDAAARVRELHELRPELTAIRRAAAPG